LLKEEFKADIVVFDPARVKALATRAHPRRFPLGIEHVVVNGKLVLKSGSPTGDLPGRALRRGAE
jgi:N-acyl-D-amino-acid deacylase